MTTRSLKLKLIVPRGGDAEQVRKRQALWRTHEFVNDAVAHYETLLLELRQRDTVVSRDSKGVDRLIPAATYQELLRTRISRATGKQATDDQLALFRKLYEEIVPSAQEGKGNGAASADAARTYHSPLVDKKSKGGAKNQASDDVWRTLVPLASDPIAFAKAATALCEHEKLATNRTGRHPRWLEAHSANKPEWTELARSWVNEKLTGGGANTLVTLRSQGLLPLVEPFAKGRIEGGDQGLGKHERMAFGLAVDHLLSFESWEKRTRAQYDERDQRLREWDATHGEEGAQARAVLAQWESAFSERLSKVSFWSADSRYRIGLRELRESWTRQYEWLRAHPSASHEEAVAHLKELQSKLGRDFGSAALLEWLSHPERRQLVLEKKDLVRLVAVRNAFESILERTHQLPLFTGADARLHPRFALFDPPNNGNSPNFSVRSEAAGRLSVTLSLLVPAADGVWAVEAPVSFALAPSNQAAGATVAMDKRVLSLVFRPQGEAREAALHHQLGGSNLLFDRDALEARSPEELRRGALGGVFIKLSITVGEGAEEELARRSKVRAWLSSGPKKRATRERPPLEGMRVLAIDLGIRSAISGSVFRLATAGSAPGKAFALPPSSAQLEAVHERSFQCQLPGESVEAEVEARRLAAVKAWVALRSSLRHLQQFGRVFRVQGEVERVREMLAQLSVPDPRRPDPEGTLRLEASALAELASLAGTPAFAVQGRKLWWEQRGRLAAAISTWRRGERGRKQLPARERTLGGKSMWAIEQLERARKLLLSWNRLHAPDQAEVRRLDRAKQGMYAKRLLAHIDRLKDDRIKTTADLIVQSARGLVYQHGRWQERHEPVDLIVLEDLTRFRMQTDRPRHENSQLMRWAHRELGTRIEEQAQVYGIPVSTTAASFTSRFDSVTGAPGVRCLAVSRDYLEFLKSEAGAQRRARLDELRVDLAKLQPGDLVPHDGGPVFVALDGPAGLRFKDADINAAQNIAIRYLQRDSEAFRCVTRELGDSRGYVSKEFGADSLNAAAFGGRRVCFEIEGDGPGARAKAFKDTRSLVKSLGIEVPKEDEGAEPQEAAAPEEDPLAAEEAAALAALEGAQEDAVVLFRDRSTAAFGGRWVPSKIFWGYVRLEVVRRLRQSPRSGAEPRLHG